ncbi:MAG: pilus assembly protein PilM [Pirellulales bacterium]
MNDSASHSGASGAGHVGACANCGQLAPMARAFCGACGARLWEPCLQCGTRNSVAERFCSQCGADLTCLLSGAQTTIDEQLSRAAALENEGQLLEAVEALADIADHDHSRLASRLQEVHRRRSELSTRRLEAVAERAALFDEARRLQLERKYAAAHATLARVPASLRDQATRGLLVELELPLAEIKQLRSTLAKSLRNGHSDGGLPIAERLFQLEPHADDVRQVCEQLRLQHRQRNAVLAKKLLAKARDAMTANDYIGAGEILGQSPQPEDDNDRKLFAAIEERVWLARQLSSAPFADETLLRMAAHLVKLQPNDANARKLQVAIASRLSRAENRAGRPYVPWARAAAHTRLGAPVEPVSNVAKIHWEQRAPELTNWVSNLRRNLVALGLALAGLGDVPLSDLEFKWGSATSWLSRLASARGRRRAAVAWGLDFGTSGLKFVQLARHKDVITVERSGIVAYVRDQTAAEIPDIQSLLTPAFEQFRAEQSPGEDRLVVSFPGVQSLGRFFTLPRMNAKKLQAALEFEVDKQIPLPPEEIVFGAHFWNGAADTSEAPQQQVILAAAKQAHVALRAAAFADWNPKSLSLQSECVALVNVLLHCHADQIAQFKPNDAIALIDVGDVATNVVAVSPLRGPWFRTIHRGVRSFNRPLVDAFSVTWQQANQIRQQWPGPLPMSAVERALAPAIENFTRDVRLALRCYEEAAAARIVRINVAGGGCDQFGLLRAWSQCGSIGDKSTVGPPRLQR